MNQNIKEYIAILLSVLLGTVLVFTIAVLTNLMPLDLVWFRRWLLIESWIVTAFYFIYRIYKA